MSALTIDFLKHIKKELDFLTSNSAKISFEDFANDDFISRAFIRSLEVIGEACKKVPDDIRFRYAEFDWSGFAKFRDRLIHHYWGVDYELVWNAIQEEIPLAKVWIDLIIEREEAE